MQAEEAAKCLQKHLFLCTDTLKQQKAAAGRLSAPSCSLPCLIIFGTLPDAVFQPGAEHTAEIQQHIRHPAGTSRRKALDIFVQHRREQSQKQDIAGCCAIRHAPGTETAAQQQSQQRKFAEMRHFADVVLNIVRQMNIQMLRQKLRQRSKPAANLGRLLQWQRRIIIDNAHKTGSEKNP